MKFRRIGKDSRWVDNPLRNLAFWLYEPQSGPVNSDNVRIPLSTAIAFRLHEHMDTVNDKIYQQVNHAIF